MSSEYQGEDQRSPAPARAPADGRRVVVTGAAGFIGSHLVDRLLDRGCEVIGIDNFDPWYEPCLKRANLAAACRHHRFSLRIGDLGHAGAPELAELFVGADVVFHLAGRPGVQDSWGPGFADCNRLNTGVTQLVFEAALAAGVARVVYASSSSVYGTGGAGVPVDGTGGAGVPVDGTGGAGVVDPISPYGVSKAAGEQLARVYGRRGLDVVTLRYFTVFGPRQRPDMAVSRLLAAAAGPAARPFLRRGSGRQRREFTYVADVVEATMAAGLNTEVSLAGMTFDVGGGCRVSLNHVIEAVEGVTGRPPHVVARPPSPGDPELTAADIEPIGRALGWRPTTGLLDGLAEQWRWWRSQPALAAGPGGEPR